MQDTAAGVDQGDCGMQERLDGLSSRPLQQIYNLDKKIRAGPATGHLLLEREILHQVCQACLLLNKLTVPFGPK